MCPCKRISLLEAENERLRAENQAYMEQAQRLREIIEQYETGTIKPSNSRPLPPMQGVQGSVDVQEP